MGRTLQESLEIDRRRALVAEHYLEGLTQSQIARELGVSQGTVSHDLKAIRQQWQASANRDFDEAVGIELAKLDKVEREAWKAWNRSLEPAESTRVMQQAGNKRAEKTTRQQHGDPRFLEQIQRCIAARRALLGLDAPTRIAPTSPDGEEAYHSHVMAELMRLAEAAKSGPVIVDAEYIAAHVEASLEQ